MSLQKPLLTHQHSNHYSMENKTIQQFREEHAWRKFGRTYGDAKYEDLIRMKDEDLFHEEVANQYAEYQIKRHLEKAAERATTGAIENIRGHDIRGPIYGPATIVVDKNSILETPIEL